MADTAHATFAATAPTAPLAARSDDPVHPRRDGQPDLLPVRIAFGDGPAAIPRESTPGGPPLDPARQRGSGWPEGGGGSGTDGTGTSDTDGTGGGSSTDGPMAPWGGVVGRPLRPGDDGGPASGSPTGTQLAHRRPSGIAEMVKRLRRGRAGTGVGGALAQLRRSGLGRVSGLTAEDWRVIVILVVALIVALGGQVAIPAVAAVAAPAAAATDTALVSTVGAPSPAVAGPMVADPTSKGQITTVTAHGLAEIRAKFGPVLRSEACWDPHAWNPTSDHPLGKACDVFVSPAGKFAAVADPAGLEHGNQLVAWLRQYAGPLQVAYVIWQGRIWSPRQGDRPYNGGGVYDPTDPTGGHFDHIHISFLK